VDTVQVGLSGPLLPVSSEEGGAKTQISSLKVQDTLEMLRFVQKDNKKQFRLSHTGKTCLLTLGLACSIKKGKADQTSAE